MCVCHYQLTNGVPSTHNDSSTIGISLDSVERERERERMSGEGEGDNRERSGKERKKANE